MNKNLCCSFLFLLGCFCQSFVFACIESASTECHIDSDYPYASGYGSATIKLYPAISSPSPRFSKVVVVVSDYDPLNSRTKDFIYELVDRNVLFKNLRYAGYDIIVFKPTDSNTYIQRNAFALVTFLQQLNEFSSLNEVKVLGLSLGGVVSKYAIDFMDYRGLNHKVDTYISFDAPHQGAHIPLGFQQIPEFFQAAAQSLQNKISGFSFFNILPLPFMSDYISEFSEADSFLESTKQYAGMISQDFLQSPLAKQLLIQHYQLGEYHHYLDRVEFEKERVFSNYSNDPDYFAPISCDQHYQQSRYMEDYNMPMTCSFLSERKVAYGDNFCESIYKAELLGAYGFSHNDPDFAYPTNSYVCFDLMDAYRNRDAAKLSLNKINKLKQDLRDELAMMAASAKNIYSIGITNGSLNGEKLDSVQVGQTYIKYNGRFDAKNINIYLEVYAASSTDGMTYFQGRLRAPDPDMLGRSRRNYGHRIRQGTSDLPFLDNVAGGGIPMSAQFANLFNLQFGEDFGNIYPQTEYHTFVPTCSALNIVLDADDCHFDNEQQAASLSPFDKVYHSGKPYSVSHLEMSQDLSDSLYKDITKQ